MLKFKLMRFGKRGEPHYRIVVVERRSKRDGMYIDQVGIYDPLLKEKNVKLENAKIKEWLSKGAKPTETVHDMFAKAGLLEKRVRVKVEKKKKEKKKA